MIIDYIILWNDVDNDSIIELEIKSITTIIGNRWFAIIYILLYIVYYFVFGDCLIWVGNTIAILNKWYWW